MQYYKFAVLLHGLQHWQNVGLNSCSFRLNSSSQHPTLLFPCIYGKMCILCTLMTVEKYELLNTYFASVFTNDDGSLPSFAPRVNADVQMAPITFSSDIV